MIRTRKMAAALVVLAVMSSGNVRAGTISASLAGDFSITNGNPNVTLNNGTWTYGYYTPSISDPIGANNFNAFIHEDSGLAGFSDLQYWNTKVGDLPSHSVDPNIIYNKGQTTVQSGSQYGDIDFAPGEVTFGPYLGPVVARWTAPKAGAYDIAAAFQTVQHTANTPPSSYVFLNSIQAYKADLGPVGSASHYNSIVNLTAGENVDFVVYGGDTNNKTTQVDATISAVPEPATLLLCGSATALGLAQLWRRRRPANDPA